MRIVGGRFRSRPLAAPRSNATRPTSDRVREALFNILTHRLGTASNPEAPLAGHRVLDLFAGTGALGLEALSRGADFCLFVETDATTRGLIRQNCEQLGVLRQIQIYRRSATSLGPRPKNISPFSLIFADPPYGQGLAEQALLAARKEQWLAQGALIVLEEHKHSDATLPPAFTQLDRRLYGDTALTLFTCHQTGPDKK